MILYWTLDDDNNPVPTEDVLVWGQWFEEASQTGRRFVAQDTLNDGTQVSTVFLGLDHGMQMFGDHLPLIFETMIFYAGDYGDEVGQWRYSTWTQAQAGHDQSLEVAKAVVAATQASVDDAITRLLP